MKILRKYENDDESRKVHRSLKNHCFTYTDVI